MHLHELDVTQLVTALGVAIPAILAAINTYRNGRLLKKHDALLRQHDQWERACFTPAVLPTPPE